MFMEANENKVEKLIAQARQRCPKHMWNGPCGASYDGKCELGGKCSWAKAIDEIRQAGMEEGLLRLFGAAPLTIDAQARKYTPSFFDKEFVVTTELSPPAKPDINKLHGIINKLKNAKNLVGAVNVTDNPLGVPHMDGLVVAIELKRNGFEPIYQITCRGKTKEIMISKLLAAKAFGITNVLALTGDFPKEDRQAFFQLDACLLAHLIKTHEQLNGLCVGVAINPHAKPMENELLKFRKKMNYADFAQTQPVFEEETLEKFATLVDEFRDKVLVGILPLTSAEMAQALNKVPGIKVSAKLINALKKEGANAGIERARTLVEMVRALGFKGVHLMCFNDYELLGKILK